MSKTAVVVFNLGGPDSISAVKPFLFNLFNDRAIIDFPQPFRWLLAKLISILRSRKAKNIYKQIGGKSPILEQTNAQAEALEKKLKELGKEGEEYKTFVSMRYWNPMSSVVAKKVKAYEPDRVILLPLYPQFSTATSGSSFADWKNSAAEAGLTVPSTSICCYPGDKQFLIAHAQIIRDMYWKASEEGKPRVLFSAHGLPEKIIAEGDPYQWQVEKTVEHILQILSIDEIDYSICYQSRVGPMEWIGPSIGEEIKAAGEDKCPVLVVPVSFVSEHSETLVELDIQYRKLAEKSGVTGYWRAPALGTDANFIEALAQLCIRADNVPVCSYEKARICPHQYDGCPHVE